ncbi:radical SAM/SPASM domain-containing protein [Mycobacterium parmense]|uniref:radical SAM/SPASM domain-containing protein n=1 Tax=Mycobacterium parmense TaxID=185642 RepID=UPI0021F3B924|nr:radical SAM protein [Mycobacterium parmense]
MTNRSEPGVQRRLSRPPARTAYAVWELTLACNLACSHCGSRAGNARPHELSTSEALDVVDQLAQVGIVEVTLIGGEAFLRPDWLEIAAAITNRGMRCTLTTGGYKLSPTTAQRMRAAGIVQASISIDGMEQTHDALRGRKGSWQSCFRTAEHLQSAGIAVACNTQVNRRTIVEVPLLYQALLQAGTTAWQLQLTVPLGRAADQAELLLQPCELLAVFDVLARVAERAEVDGMRVYAANNLGYHGPYEQLLRSPDGNQSWHGCQAGLSTIGIEADGTVKGCPSLPTADYSGGTVRRQRIAEMLSSAPEMNFNLLSEQSDRRGELWGFCRTCAHADTCRGGCSWTAHTLFGRRGNNPYCHHRALELQRQGMRERLLQIEPAIGVPFDYGRFTAVTESDDTPWPHHARPRLSAHDIQWPAPLFGQSRLAGAAEGAT